MEILYFDHAEGAELIQKGREIWLSTLKEEFKDEPFILCLNSQLDQDLLYKFLRKHRHLILHEGEVKRKLGPEPGIIFKGWDNDAVDEVSQKLVSLAKRLTSEAKEKYPRQLASESRESTDAKASLS